jgi:hypothetical protein
MEGDIARGRYYFRADPPFAANNIEEEADGIAPDEIQPSSILWQPGYNRFLTEAQRARYLEKVQECLDHARANGIVENSDLVDNNTNNDGNDDMPLDVQFAFYSVDFHINRHRLARRSCFNLCRSKREMDELALWRQDVQFVDSFLLKAKDSESALPSSSSCSAAAAAAVIVPALSRTRPEPSPPTSPIMTDAHQIALLHYICNINNINKSNPQSSSSSSHRKHVRAVRSRFKSAMRQRAAQRAEGLLTAHYEALERFLQWQDQDQEQEQEQKQKKLLNEKWTCEKPQQQPPQQQRLEGGEHLHLQPPSGLKIKLRMGQDQGQKPRSAGGLKIRLRVKQDQNQNQNQNQDNEQKSKMVVGPKLKLKLR